MTASFLEVSHQLPIVFIYNNLYDFRVFFLKKTNKKQVTCLHRVLVAAYELLSCGLWDVVLQLGIEPRPPALGVYSLSRRTTRDALSITF